MYIYIRLLYVLIFHSLYPIKYQNISPLIMVAFPHFLSLPQQLSEGPSLWHRTCAGALVRVRVVRVRVVVRLLRGLRVVLAMAWVDVGLTLGSGRLPSSTRQPYRNGQNHYGKSWKPRGFNGSNGSETGKPHKNPTFPKHWTIIELFKAVLKL